MMRALLARELRLAWRSGAEILNPLWFFLIVITLFPFGVGAAPQLLAQIAPGVVWVAALLAALTYVATTVIKIPTPTGGYVHPGDGMVLLSGWLLGPWWGGAAAGIGSMLVDLLGGYASFVPGTLVIKFLDAMAAALVVKALGKVSSRQRCSG